MLASIIYNYGKFCDDFKSTLKLGAYEKRDISKYRLSQLSGISQSSLGRIMAQENLPSLITLEKICTALGVTLSQFFQEGNSENLTEEQKEVLGIWNDLSTNEQETVMSMLRGLRK